jgi:hypothetical protein
MVHSSALIVATNGECLTYSVFSLGEIIHFGSLEFIADCFSGLSLYPKESDSDAAFRGTTRNGPPLLWAMIEGSTEEFYTTSREEGVFSLPSSLSHGTGGYAYSCRSHTMVGGQSGCSGHDDGVTHLVSL